MNPNRYGLRIDVAQNTTGGQPGPAGEALGESAAILNLPVTLSMMPVIPVRKPPPLLAAVAKINAVIGEAQRPDQRRVEGKVKLERGEILSADGRIADAWR